MKASPQNLVILRFTLQLSPDSTGIVLRALSLFFYINLHNDNIKD